MIHLQPIAFPLLLLTGLAAGLVDAIAGGGGLIALPVLLNLGLPPQIALGTNKLQSVVGTSTASRHYAKMGVADFRSCLLGMAFAFAGALAGSLTAERMTSEALARVIPWLLASILVYAIFRPEVGQTRQPARVGERTFFVLAGLALGFYDGFFGPGAGSFWTIAIVLALGRDFTGATGATKFMNAASNFGALAIFIPSGRVDYGAAVFMCAGQVIGARIGAGLVVKKGARFVRPVFLTIVALLLAKLIYARTGH